VADVSGLADADNDQFTTVLERADGEFDGRIESRIELGADGLKSGQFDRENSASFNEVTHGARVVEMGVEFNPGTARDSHAKAREKHAKTKEESRETLDFSRVF
jgi:hypothetical protein